MSGQTQESGLKRLLERNQGTLRSLKRGWSRFTSHKIGVIGLTVLLGMVIMAVFAPWI
ncbi:MAG: hypothetical protein SV377_06765, partial [Halobacteria archaeon]|nr:hypothetical protein [Halobacteria archaeon]